MRRPSDTAHRLSGQLNDPPAAHVWLVMAHATSRAGEVWLTAAAVAERTGYARTTAKAAIRRLRDVHDVIEDTGKRKGATSQVVVYRFTERVRETTPYKGSAADAKGLANDAKGSAARPVSPQTPSDPLTSRGGDRGFIASRASVCPCCTAAISPGQRIESVALNDGTSEYWHTACAIDMDERHAKAAEAESARRIRDLTDPDVIAERLAQIASPDITIKVLRDGIDNHECGTWLQHPDVIEAARARLAELEAES